MASHTLAPFPEELLATKKQIREQARSYGLGRIDEMVINNDTCYALPRFQLSP